MLRPLKADMLNISLDRQHGQVKLAWLVVQKREEKFCSEPHFANALQKHFARV
jgi:hypothetical protein